MNWCESRRQETVPTPGEPNHPVIHEVESDRKDPPANIGIQDDVKVKRFRDVDGVLYEVRTHYLSGGQQPAPEATADPAATEQQQPRRTPQETSRPTAPAESASAVEGEGRQATVASPQEGIASNPPTKEMMEPLLDLDQIAALVHLRKRSMENYKWPKRKEDPLPDPDFPGKPGQRGLWKWATIRPWLGRTFNLPLPKDPPDMGRR
jgi:hypothetical protein